MLLKLKPFNASITLLYKDHSHFHSGDAGLDLFAPNEVTIGGRSTAPIHLQVACEMEGGRPYLLMPRSSIVKTPLRLSNSIGLIDGGYRGELIAHCDNINNEPYTVEAGQRLFQVVAMDGSPLELQLVSELSESTRGDGGFGSTGT
ncbi:MAG: deoxyuridine 5'-triphosphate nucleotidohydrolase [Candidatus Marinimicrobia bacterium]|nr:deoxyuridine 5'-triphosphate nucleotidohydrolase [Candidatus Neomarinimicrobiota bacterium]